MSMKQNKILSHYTNTFSLDNPCSFLVDDSMATNSMRGRAIQSTKQWSLFSFESQIILLKFIVRKLSWKPDIVNKEEKIVWEQ